jgi:hypothetical protein
MFKMSRFLDSPVMIGWLLISVAIGFLSGLPYGLLAAGIGMIVCAILEALVA